MLDLKLGIFEVSCCESPHCLIPASARALLAPAVATTAAAAVESRPTFICSSSSSSLSLYAPNKLDMASTKGNSETEETQQKLKSTKLV